MKQRLMRWWKQLICIHLFDVVQQSNTCSVEICEHCGKIVVYGE